MKIWLKLTQESKVALFRNIFSKPTILHDLTLTYLSGTCEHVIYSIECLNILWNKFKHLHFIIFVNNVAQSYFYILTITPYYVLQSSFIQKIHSAFIKFMLLATKRLINETYFVIVIAISYQLSFTLRHPFHSVTINHLFQLIYINVLISNNTFRNPQCLGHFRSVCCGLSSLPWSIILISDGDILVSLCMSRFKYVI